MQKSSWQLTTVLLAACRSNLSQSQDHLFPFLVCILSLYTKQMAETHTEARNGSRGITLSSTPPEAAVEGAQLTRAQPVSADKHPLPCFQRRSLGNVTLAPLLSGSPGSFSPRRYAIITPPAEHRAHKGTWSDYQFIWQRYSRLASVCRTGWPPHTGLVRVVGRPERTEGYSFQIMYYSVHLQKYLVVKPSHHLLN